MKLLVLLPLLLVVSWWAVRALGGCPVLRADLRVAVGLLTGLYLLATAGLGLFWVARMELPVFDWHYLLGYALLLAALWHFLLELPQLAAAVRRLARAKNRKPTLHRRPARWRQLVGAGLLLLAVGLTVGLGVWLIPEQPLRHSRAQQEAALLPGSSSGSEAERQQTPTATNEAREVMTVLLKESAIAGGVLVRRGLFFGPKVPSVREVDRARLVKLPQPIRGQGRDLGASLRWALDQARSRRSSPTLQELATLLFAAAGVSEVRSGFGETLYLRTAPSAGALYPVELYFTTTGLAELPAGVYRYHPQEHALQAVARGFNRALWEKLVGGVSEEEVHAFLLTGVFQRTVWKYGSRGYRYVVLDAGHTAANLALAAFSLSSPLTLSPAFADAPAEQLLGVDPAEEGVLAVASLGESPRAAHVVPPFREAEVTQPWEQQELTRLSQALTRWEWGEGGPWAWAPQPPKTLLPQWGQDGVLSLVTRRRSFRRFAPLPLAPNTVEAITSLVQGSLSLVPGGEGVGVAVVVVREQQLPSGVYRLDVASGKLSLVRQGDCSKLVYRAGLSQELLARAAATFVFTLDPAKLARYGKRGLRFGLFAAGVAGETVYLAAEAQGLGACGVGAFEDSRIAELLGPDNGCWPVYLVAIGRK